MKNNIRHAAIAAFFFASILALAFALRPAQIVRTAQIAHPVQTAGPVQTKPAANVADMKGTFARLPLSFEANSGQTDTQVKYIARGSGYTIFLTDNDAVIKLQDRQGAGAVLRLKVAGADEQPKSETRDRLAGHTNYFIGNDPKKWHTDVPTFSQVRYASVYPGIDLVYHGNQRQLEYDFVVAPGFDPREIRMACEGADKIDIGNDGDLVIGIDGKEIRFRKPLVDQESNGVRREVAAQFVLDKQCRAGFQVAAYDRSKELVIHPVLAYSTYLGGSGAETAQAIAVDATGSAYVAGYTNSLDFPVTPGAFQTTNKSDSGLGNPDGYVAKLNPAGNQIVYGTYLGGSCTDIVYGITVDAAGEAYITGETGSGLNPANPLTGDGPMPECGPLQNPFVAFPQMNPFQASFGGSTDAFITKLNSLGNGLIFSSFLGGGNTETGYSIAVDAMGSAYVTGFTISDGNSGAPGGGPFPTTPGAFQTAVSSSRDAFVVKVTAVGTRVYSTRLGGGGDDFARGIAVDSSGNAYVTGSTTSGSRDFCNVQQSSPFPTTPGAYQPMIAPGEPVNCGMCCNNSTVGFNQNVSDAFVTKLNSSGSALVYSTYLGGGFAPPNTFDGAFDEGHAIAVDSSGDAYVTGVAGSGNFPTTGNAIQPNNSGNSTDAFVTKLNPAGSVLVYSTYLGGSGYDEGNGIAVSSANEFFVSGTGGGQGFPAVDQIPPPGPTPPPGPFPTPPPPYGGFVTRFTASGNPLVYSTAVFATTTGKGVAIDSLGNAYLTGDTQGGIQTVNPAQPNFGGVNDAYVLKLGPADLCAGVICAAIDQCHNSGICNPATGVCSNPPKPLGTACNDFNNCTQFDVCNGTGTCAGTPVTCPASDQCHDTGACDPATGLCSNPLKPAGSPCDDGNLCTRTDVCDGAGTCVGTPVTCPPGDQCRNASTCNPATGCSPITPKPNGTACNDGDVCTTNDVCTNGFCGGTSGAGQSCSTGLPGPSNCSNGTTVCTQSGLVCQPSPQSEVCDGLDNDCNGIVDDNIPSVQCNTGLPGACAQGTTSCQSGATVCTPTTQNCGAPTLGNYPNKSMLLSTDGTNTPDAAPVNVVKITVSTSTDFKGKLEGYPATGIVRITDAHPAGTYIVTVTGFSNSGQATAKTFTLTVSTPATCSPVTFAPQANFGANSGPISVAVGDFNGDGNQDLAVANFSAPTVSILLGDGAGGFSGPTNIPLGGQLRSVAVGDFNGDGNQDLAVANENLNNVSILLGNGTGSFSAPINFPAGAQPYSVAVGDFNGDGKQDLAVANNGSANVSILLGDGTGSFSGPTNFPAGAQPYSVAVGDFNGDSNQDLAVSNAFSGNVSILLGNGAGGFSAPTNFPVGTQPRLIAVGDFNGDGNQDLAVGKLSAPNVSILLGNGTGGFSGPTNFPTGSLPAAVAVGDFNGDGKQDLAVANGGANNMSILLGNGDGTFSGPTNFGTGPNPASVAVGDFNGDARQDLALANNGSNTVSILLRTCVDRCAGVTCTASDQCHDAGTCDSTTGVCSNPPKQNGTACNDGNACTQTDTCQTGTCVGSSPVTCTASDQCHDVGTCNPTTGVCSNPPKQNGAACNDNNACTQTDTCQSGTCIGSNPVTCTASDQCHSAGACNSTTGVCSNPPKPNGSTCNDANLCTTNDVCTSGVCGGTPKTCTASDQCHDAGVCDPSSGVCSNSPKAITTSIAANFNGTAISAGNYIWFNSVLKPSGLGSTAVTFKFTNQTITSSAFALSVPDAMVTFDPAATTATTTFTAGMWVTRVPSSGLAGNTFFSALSYLVPANIPGGVKNVTWSGTVTSDSPTASLQWQWAAAVYTSFTSNYTLLGVKPVDDTKASAYKNSDHAGTPENYKSNTTGGATGGGASNYTGSYSGTGSVGPCSAKQK